MKHTKQNLEKYLADNSPRFRLLARQMMDMHTPEFDKHVGTEIKEAHSDASAALMRLATLTAKSAGMKTVTKTNPLPKNDSTYFQGDIDADCELSDADPGL